MTPRIETKSPWTPFPTELQDLICEVFTERYADEYDLEGYHFIAQGRIYATEILLRVGLNNPNQLKQHNFELSVIYDKETEKALEVIQGSLSVLEPSFEELLEEDFADEDYDRYWSPIKGAKAMAHLRYSTINTELEEEADRLLSEYEKKLVYGDTDYEDEESSIEDLLH